jgi:hypothetical protein
MNQVPAIVEHVVALEDELELQRAARKAAEARVAELEEDIITARIVRAAMAPTTPTETERRLEDCCGALASAELRIEELEGEVAVVATLRRAVAAALVERDLAISAATGQDARLVAAAILTPDDPELPHG